jgi:hypothetical protein
MKTKAKNGKAPLSDVEADARGIKVDRDGLVRCRVCGCTERNPCEPPCAWQEVDLCTFCAEAASVLAEWMEGAHRANKSALWREVEREQETAAGCGASVLCLLVGVLLGWLAHAWTHSWLDGLMAGIVVFLVLVVWRAH